jgi:DNA repair exonuclease SbcCD ATPase subunit
MSKISKIQKNRKLLFLSFFLIIFLLIALPVGFFYFRSKNIRVSVLASHNQNLEIYNQAFNKTQKSYQEITDLTQQFTVDFSQIENFDQQKEMLQKKSKDIQDKKVSVVKINQEIEVLKKNLKNEPNDEIKSLSQKIDRSLNKYQDFNGIIISYLDYYSCQLGNLSTELSLELKIIESRSKIETSQNRKELADNFILLSSQIEDLAGFFKQYQNCFTNDIKKMKPENLAEIIEKLTTSNQELSENLKNLAVATKDSDQNKIQELIQKSEKIQTQINDLSQKLKESLQQTLLNFDNEIKSADDDLQKNSQAIAEYSNSLKQKYKWY